MAAHQQLKILCTFCDRDKSFMSSVGAICKDDNSGEARVFVNQGTGTPPYQFDWDFESMEEETDFTPVDSFSVIKGLFPGLYYVNITDAMGCVVRDSIEVKSNPNICISHIEHFHLMVMILMNIGK